MLWEKIFVLYLRSTCTKKHVKTITGTGSSSIIEEVHKEHVNTKVDSGIMNKAEVSLISFFQTVEESYESDKDELGLLFTTLISEVKTEVTINYSQVYIIKEHLLS